MIKHSFKSVHSNSTCYKEMIHIIEKKEKKIVFFYLLFKVMSY